MRNDQVVTNWKRSQSGVNGTKSFRTDGNDLYSYNLLIGFTTKCNKKVLLDYTAKSGYFMSMTTSGKHISPAAGVADVIMSPSLIEGTDILSERKK